MTLNVVLGSFWCANEVMHVHDGQPSLNEAGIDPGNLQVRFVHETCMNRPRSPGLWGEPWLNEQYPTRGEMMCHTLDSSGEVLQGFDVSNSTEETSHDVKRASERKVYHVSVV